jgi:hypothetical protein
LTFEVGQPIRQSGQIRTSIPGIERRDKIRQHYVPLICPSGAALGPGSGDEGARLHCGGAVRILANSTIRLSIEVLCIIGCLGVREICA